jgi:hypothetical protein
MGVGARTDDAVFDDGDTQWVVVEVDEVVRRIVRSGAIAGVRPDADCQLMAAC